MAALYKRAVPYAKDAMSLPVENVEQAVPFYERIMGFQVLARKDEPHKAVDLGRDDIRMRPFAVHPQIGVGTRRSKASARHGDRADVSGFVVLPGAAMRRAPAIRS